MLLLAVDTNPLGGLYAIGSESNGRKPFHSYSPVPGTGRVPDQWRCGIRPAATQPMFPSTSAYTRFSVGSSHLAAAALKVRQSLARLSESEAMYPAVPGSEPTKRSAKARC